MADTKISADSNLASPASGDLIPIVDIDVADSLKNKTVTWSQIQTAFDLSTLPDGTGLVTSVDEVIYLDAGVQKRKRFAEIGLSEFLQDGGFALSSHNHTSLTSVTSIYGTTMQAGYNSSTCIDYNLTTFDVVFGGLVDFRFSDGGAFLANGKITSYSGTITSDRKLKKDFTQIEDAVVKVKQLTGYEYTMRKTDQRSAGLVAQDVQKILPQAVETEKDLQTDEPYLTLNYNAVIGLLVESIKELTARVEELENDRHNRA